MSENRGPETAPAPFPPPIADGLDRALDPQSVTVARISGGIAVAVVAFASLIAVVSVVFAAPLPGLVRVLLLPGWLVLVALLAWLAWGWPAVRYRHISYRVDAQGIRIRRGVFWKSETTVPASRVQHTDVSRGPLERGFGLATLIIHTAGTENASVGLNGLPHEAALGIRDHLIEGGEDDAV